MNAALFGLGWVSSFSGTHLETNAHLLKADRCMRHASPAYVSPFVQTGVETCFDGHYARWMPHGVSWRFWVWCATLSRRARRPPTTRTAGSVGSRGSSSTSRSLREEERSCWGPTRRRRRWNAAAAAASPGTVSCVSVVVLFWGLLATSLMLVCFFFPSSYSFLQSGHISLWYHTRECELRPHALSDSRELHSESQGERCPLQRHER